MQTLVQTDTYFETNFIFLNLAVYQICWTTLIQVVMPRGEMCLGRERAISQRYLDIHFWLKQLLTHHPCQWCWGKIISFCPWHDIFFLLDYSNPEWDFCCRFHSLFGTWEFPRFGFMFFQAIITFGVCLKAELCSLVLDWKGINDHLLSQHLRGAILEHLEYLETVPPVWTDTILL